MLKRAFKQRQCESNRPAGTEHRERLLMNYSCNSGSNPLSLRRQQHRGERGEFAELGEAPNHRINGVVAGGFEHDQGRVCLREPLSFFHRI